MKIALEDFLCPDKAQIQYLAKKYNTMDYSSGLRTALHSIFPKRDIARLAKPELHELFNHLLVHHYSGEAALKYELFLRASRQKVVAAFEIPVNKSRADFLTVNGHTTSYEIKSGLDNLDKLQKQSEDYLRAFEYNFVVIDSKHLAGAKKILPASFGIISFINGRKKVHHPVTLNNRIDPRMQLELLTKKEFTTAFKNCFSRDQVIRKHTDAEINTAFKTALKIRYAKRWSFLLTNSAQILPVDLQFFFNSNISPELIYTMG
jgi:hypothetical protein